MADTLTKAERSELMAKVGSRGNASTENRLMTLLRLHRLRGWRRGVLMTGRPDFVFRSAKLAVFVDGCFWHGCPHHSRIPKTNRPFWKQKIEANRDRDRIVTRALKAKGWRVLRIWEHELAKINQRRCLARIHRALGEATLRA